PPRKSCLPEKSASTSSPDPLRSSSSPTRAIPPTSPRTCSRRPNTMSTLRPCFSRTRTASLHKSPPSPTPTPRLSPPPPPPPSPPAVRQSTDNTSAILVTRHVTEAFEISNRFAPEHLSIPDASHLKLVQNAGSVFVGPYSPEAAGDYVSGPNHVLPTNGAARA